jgi:hypothetical protein
MHSVKGIFRAGLRYVTNYNVFLSFSIGGHSTGQLTVAETPTGKLSCCVRLVHKKLTYLQPINPSAVPPHYEEMAKIFLSARTELSIN